MSWWCSCLPYWGRCGGVSANQICISSMTKTETWEYSAGDTWHFWFKFPTSPAKFLILHSRECLFCQIPYSLSTHHCQIPEGFGGGGGGMLMFQVVRCILQTLNTVKGLHNYHKFYQHPPAYYAKKRVYSEHLNLPIPQLEREKDLNYFM